MLIYTCIALVFEAKGTVFGGWLKGKPQGSHHIWAGFARLACTHLCIFCIIHMGEIPFLSWHALPDQPLGRPTWIPLPPAHIFGLHWCRARAQEGPARTTRGKRRENTAARSSRLEKAGHVRGPSISISTFGTSNSVQLFSGHHQ